MVSQFSFVTSLKSFLIFTLKKNFTAILSYYKINHDKWVQGAALSKQ